MSSDDYLARVRDRIDVGLMSTLRVVVIGVGSVGSEVAKQLAVCGMHDFCLVDGADLKEHNISRHALTRPYVHQNKAEAMAVFLLDSYGPDGFNVRAVPRNVDGSMSDDDLDELLEGAHIVVAATDSRRWQRRVAERALANDVPAVLPGLYENGGGEVFVSLGPRAPCFLCWDAFRTEGQALRGVSALGVEAAPVIALTVQLIVGLIDESSDFARLYVHERGEPTPQLFLFEFPHAEMTTGEVEWAPNCPSCRVGPARSRGDVVTEPGRGVSLGRSAAITETPILICAVYLILLIIGTATTNVVAILLLATASVGCPYMLMRPGHADVVSVIRTHDFESALSGLVLVALLVFSLAWHSAPLVVLLAIAMTAASTTLFARSRTS